jgi:ketosteroid isomerase-like protein
MESSGSRVARDTAWAMSLTNPQVVRTLWATLDRDPGVPWPPPPEDFDRRMRTDLLDEQIEIRTVPEFPVGGEYHGHEGMRQWATEIWEVFSEFHNKLEELIEVGDGDTIVSVQKTHGRMRHTGLETRFRWAVVWTLKDGKAAAAHGYATKAQALEAAGLSE